MTTIENAAGVVAPITTKNISQLHGDYITCDFLGAVLPEDGPYLLRWFAKEKRELIFKGQQYFRTKDALAKRAAVLDKNGFTVFYGTASYKSDEAGTKADAKNVNLKQTYYIDIDVGSNKDYSDQKSAADSLISAIGKCKLPDPLIVMSGTGFHVYWVLTEAVSPDVWIPTAKRLQAVLTEAELKTDVKVTTDIARILRPVGTHHRKTEVAILVKPIRSNFQAVSQTDFAKIVGYEYGALAGEVISAEKLFGPDTSLAVDSFILPDFIPKGTRDNTIIALAGSLRGKGMPEDVIEQYILEVNHNRCKPPLDDERIIDLAGRYREQATEKTVEGFNNRYFVSKIGGGVHVFDQQEKNIIAAGMSFQAFKQFQAGKENGARGANDWLNSTKRKTYDGIVFDPTGKAYNNQYNTYNGLNISPINGNCDKIVKHIEIVWCSGNQGQFTYVIKWMAKLVQKPWMKPEVALVLRSIEGTGKTIIVNIFLSFFGRHGFVAAQKDQVAGRFNGHLFDKILVVLEEAFFAGDHAAIATTKALVTNPTIGYDSKGKDAFSAPNYAHVISLTNNDWAVPAGGDARRWMVLDVSDEKKGDHAYFKALVAEIENGGREAFLHYLMNVDISDWNPRELAESNALHAQQVQTLLRTNPVSGWWLHVLADGEFTVNDGSISWEAEISSVEMQESYTHSTKRSRNAPAWDVAAKQLRKLLPEGKLGRARKSTSGNRWFSYKLPKLDEARQAFEATTGIDPCKM